MSFQHEALLYDGPEAFADGTLPFIREGVRAGEPVMVAVSPQRIDELRERLGDDAGAVRFADMAVLGRNPGRIIPAWRDFLAEHGGAGPVRGIGEPVWPGRAEQELVESQLHEALLNLAFADVRGFRLLCPYDRTALDDGVLHEACASHPAVVARDGRHESAAYRGVEELLAPFEVPLPAPGAPAEAIAYDEDALSHVREVVGERAWKAGLEPSRVADLVLAAYEAAANSIRHGGGNGVLRVWEEGGSLVCELRDRGRLDDPLAGRRRPAHLSDGGWGLYLAHQVCDLVQVRSDERGTVVRLHMATP